MPVWQHIITMDGTWQGTHLNEVDLHVAVRPGALLPMLKTALRGLAHLQALAKGFVSVEVESAEPIPLRVAVPDTSVASATWRTSDHLAEASLTLSANDADQYSWEAEIYVYRTRSDGDPQGMQPTALAVRIFGAPLLCRTGSAQSLFDLASDVTPMAIVGIQAIDADFEGGGLDAIKAGLATG